MKSRIQIRPHLFMLKLLLDSDNMSEETNGEQIKSGNRKTKKIYIYQLIHSSFSLVDFLYPVSSCHFSSQSSFLLLINKGIKYNLPSTWTMCVMWKSVHTHACACASCRVSGVSFTSSQVAHQYKPRQEDRYLPLHPVFVVWEVYQFQSAHPGINLSHL